MKIAAAFAFAVAIALVVASSGRGRVTDEVATGLTVDPVAAEAHPAKDGGIEVGPIDGLGTTLVIPRDRVCWAMGMVDVGDRFDGDRVSCSLHVPMLTMYDALDHRIDLARCTRENADTLRCSLAWGVGPGRVSFEWLFSLDPQYLKVTVTGLR